MENDTNNPGNAGTGLTAETATDVFASMFDDLFDDGAGTEDAIENDVQDIEQVDESDDEQSEWNSESDGEIDGDGAESVEPSDDDESVELFEIPDDVTIEVNGVKLSGKEIKEGVMLKADYTQKTQELAVERQGLHREIEETKVERYKMGEDNLKTVTALKELIAYEHYIFTPEMLENLRLTDPYTYGEEMGKVQKREDFLRQLHGWQSKQAEERIAREKEVFTENLRKSREELIAYEPAFGNKETGMPLLKGMTDMMVNDYGITMKELEEVADSRLLKVIYDLHKSKQVKAATAEAKKVLAATPKVNAPKKTGTSAGRNASQKAREELRKTGSADAAQAYFESLF